MMASSSSSSFSPSNKKNSLLSPIQQTLFKKPNSYSSSSKASRLTKRQDTVFKKANELSILCGIEVCVICYGPDGDLTTWPKDRDTVKDMARRYSELSETKRRKGSVGLCQFLEKINKSDSNKKTKVNLGSNLKYQDWDTRFDGYSVEQINELIQSLERNLARIQHRLRVVLEAQKQRTMQNTNQEQRMSIDPINHLQPQSNQVSMYLFNHGNHTFTQIPASASAFNQAQSLAPTPYPLKIYPNFNVENNSVLLGEQGTGINEFQNPNMYSCNNVNVEDYLGLLGVQGTEVNVLQNMNTSHQLVQYQPQNIFKPFYDI